VQHQLRLSELGPHAAAMGQAISSCVHCGFCLPACPTYRVLGEEMDSPRGRILLMKQALEGTLPIAEAAPYVDRCLGCLACETACPSGVRFRDLVVPFRARLEVQARPRLDRWFRSALLATMESPARFRLAAALGRTARALGDALPESLRAMVALLPSTLPAARPLPAFVSAIGPRRARVALLAGCVQRVLRPSINEATCRVLAANGIEVVIPPHQGCCGALALHAGLDVRGARLAARNRAIFPRDVDAVVTNAAGCGSAMKDQAALPVPTRDVSEVLDDLGLVTPLALARGTVVAYQDACHLGHGQGIRSAPRRLLQQVQGLTLVELQDRDLCCGSAGLYNLEQPVTAATLGRQKADAVRATGAPIVATGNIGCLTQLERHLAEGTPAIAVQHTIELVDSATRGRGA
jgi:glycolate oxidase iron-sulfur subunit